MKILFLAPQPFFVERGTPIAVRLAVQVLGSSNLAGSENQPKIDLLTYHLGAEIPIPGVRHFRIPNLKFITNIGSGISWKKLLCDIFFFFSALKLAWKTRKSPYTLVHAVEESVFIALFLKLVFKIPYVYDMDSSLTEQLLEKWQLLRPLRFLFEPLERLAVRESLAVVPVCDSLAEIAAHYGSREIAVLRDISLLNDQQVITDPPLRRELGLRESSELVVYIGNLESYQGIDLLLESFQLLTNDQRDSHLVVVGGSGPHIRSYQLIARKLRIETRVHFLGSRPMESLNRYYREADILVSPRIKGSNTPMKIYSYLHSGKAIVATDLKTHNQILTNSVALLCPPEKNAFANALRQLLSRPEMRLSLGMAAKQLADKNFTFEVFRNTLCQTYSRLLNQLGALRTS